MRHHLRKARAVYAEDGLLQTAKSALRYFPIEVNNAIFRLRHGPGIRVMDEDWDNLIILDGCRYDMFAKHADINGVLESRISLGSSSEEFMEQNFSGRTFHDTVYVNANPYIAKLGLDEGTFHAVVNCLDEWDEDLETVHPKAVSDAAREASAEFPDKRLVVHFMQPHAPFIGEIGRNIAGGGWTMDRVTDSEPSIWEQAETGKVDTDLVWEAYVENLHVVMKEVRALLAELDGKSIVTSDHGNLVGERLSPIPTRPKYGHPYGVHTEELLKVPWLVVAGDRRREITEDPPIEQDSVSDEELEDRLEALGYK